MDNRKIVCDDAGEQNKSIDASLDEISMELKPGETLILDVSDCNVKQTDVIYDKLVTRGYNVKKSHRNGQEQVVVSKK
ncbi:MAG: hypothetical protein PHV32_06645 [Eubacteriales bacterium]|nr:hypothetical protein [Eubacteriales bacterium]